MVDRILIPLSNIDVYLARFSRRHDFEELRRTDDFLDSVFANHQRYRLQSSSSDSHTGTPTKQYFDRRLDEVKPSKTDINFVVMDYLINEGYPDAAKKFAAEANIQQPPGDTETIEERVGIRNAILDGDIQTAIEKINDLDPDLLELNTSLHFSLLRLQLIELIRASSADPTADITPALEFASTHLAPLAPTDPAFLSDLECTMALLIFPQDNQIPALDGLLKPELRVTVAAQVNEAILAAKGCERQARLRRLVKLRAWAERKAYEREGKDGTYVGPGAKVWRGIGLDDGCLDLWSGTEQAKMRDGTADGRGDTAMMTRVEGDGDPPAVAGESMES